jgi:HPt (histidine-containing phosphotransfer) domain-containing protein
MSYSFAAIKNEMLSRIGGNPELLQNLMKMFPGQANGLLQGLENARAAHNAVDVALHANNLMGICRMFAATAAAQAASDLETVAQSGSTGADDQIDRLRDEVQQVIEEIKTAAAQP